MHINRVHAQIGDAIWRECGQHSWDFQRTDRPWERQRVKDLVDALKIVDKVRRESEGR